MADVTSPNLNVWYKFEDTTTTDSSGNGYTGTLIGSPIPVLGTGQIGNGMVFAGPSGGVAVPPAACNVPTSTSSFSVMGWLKSTAADTPIFGGRNSGNGNPILYLGIGSNAVTNTGTGKATVSLRDDTGGSGFIHVDGSAAINDGTFHHVAAVFDGSGGAGNQTLKLYVDGVQQSSTTTAAITTSITFDTTGCNVGREAIQPWGCVGTIDDFRFFSRALSATEISNIFSAGTVTPPPSKTFWILGTAATSPDWGGNLQDGGTTPTAALSTFGWTVAKTATSTPYWRARVGASATATTAAATSYIDSTTGPTVGTGATNTTAGDFFATPTAYSGVFASGNWTLSFGMRTGAATTVGRIRCRIWASVNATGASARELTSGAVVCSTVTMSATATTYTSSATWAAPQITLNNEYLFFQVEWNETTAGTSTSCTAQFYVSAASIATTSFTVTTTATLSITEAGDTISAAGNVPLGPVTGTLAVTETPDTISAAGKVAVNGTLSITQANETLVSAGGPIASATLSTTQAAQTLSATGTVAAPAITGTLSITQANQTLSAAGGAVVGGTLSVTQAAQTLSATGSLSATGTLTVTQAAQTLSAAGRVTVGGALALTQANQTISAIGAPAAVGTLTITQANQTLSAAGTVLITGALTQTQANQTLVAAGGPRVGGTLSATQANQTLVAAGGPSVGATLNVTQAAQTLSAAGTVQVRGTLTVNQANQTLSGTGSVLTGIGGSLNVTQANQTISAAGTVPLVIGGSLTLTQANETLSATGTVVNRANLTATQANQTLVATGSAIAGATLNITQANQTLVAAGTVQVRGTLTVTQAAQTLSATASVLTGIGGALSLTQANETLSATGNVPAGAITGALTLTQAAQTLSASGSNGAVTAAMHTLSGGSLFIRGTFKTNVGILASLPAPGRVGSRNFVTDATTTLAAGVGTIVVGGGSNRVPVYDDGSNWRIG